MFLHAGAGTVVSDSHIIGIFDLDGKITTPDTAAYLRRAERAGESEIAGSDLPKSFIVSYPPRRRRKRSDARRRRIRFRDRVIFSHISAVFLARRAELSGR